MLRIKEDVQDLQFAEDASLTYITIGEEVNKIGEKAFYKCPNLIAIKIEESDKPIRICLDFVKDCKNLVDVTIKRNVEFYKKIKYRGVKL